MALSATERMAKLAHAQSKVAPYLGSTRDLNVVMDEERVREERLKRLAEEAEERLFEKAKYDRKVGLATHEAEWSAALAAELFLSVVCSPLRRSSSPSPFARPRSRSASQRRQRRGERPRSSNWRWRERSRRSRTGGPPEKWLPQRKPLLRQSGSRRSAIAPRESPRCSR